MISSQIFRRLPLSLKKTVVQMFLTLLTIRAKRFLKEKTRDVLHLHYS